MVSKLTDFDLGPTSRRKGRYRCKGRYRRKGRYWRKRLELEENQTPGQTPREPLGEFGEFPKGLDWHGNGYASF